MRPARLTRLVLALTTTAGAIATGAVATSVPAHASTAAPSNPISVPPWATASHFVGHANPGAPLELRFWLGWRDDAAAQQLATAVSTPGSASYRHYLTSTDFITRFAPTADQVRYIQSWARANAMTPAEVPLSRLYVGVTTTVAQAESAFHTTLNTYRVQGLTLMAPATQPTLPSALVGRVRDVTGLDQHEALYKPAHIGPDNDTSSPHGAPPAAFVNAPPCAQYFGQVTDTTVPTPYGTAPNLVTCGNTPQTLRSIYGVSDAIASGIDGTGYTVAIVDAWSSPTIVADVNQYSQNHSLPQLKSGQYTDDSPPGLDQAPEDPVGTGLVDPSGWSTEETLDVETVHAMAPGANIAYVGAASPLNGAFEVAELSAIERHLGDEVSNSWGGDGNGTTEDQDIYNQMLTMATSTGIGVYYSTGDDGLVQFPSALPGVTAVGGTSVEPTAAGGVGLETGWQTDKTTLTSGAWAPAVPGAYVYGGGGGLTSFAAPAYQQGVVPASLAAGKRVVPDISADGDPTTGFIIGQTQTFSDGTHYGEFREGGTSLACPLMAGLMALVSQKQGAAVGFANPALYKLYGTSALRDVLPLAGPYGEIRHDYVSGTSGPTNTTLRSFDVANNPNHLTTAIGYDDNTGIGTPNGAAFLALGNGVQPQLPEAPSTALLAVAGLVIAGAALRLRSRIHR